MATRWLSRLRPRREWLGADALAGITVAAYLVPQVMAYAAIAGLPPVTGLYAFVAATLAYYLLGSSRQLSVGPESTTALMTAVAVAGLSGGRAPSETYAALCAALAVVVGLVCVAGWLLRLGFLADLLSKPVLVGYMTGVAVLMVVSQLGKISGISTEGDSTIAQVASAWRHRGELHWPTVALAAGLLALLLVGQRVWPRLPHPLFAVLIGTALVAVFDLTARGIDVVGEVPAGLPVPDLPLVGLGDVAAMLVPALGIAVVGYSDNVLTGRAFASKAGGSADSEAGPELDPNREFLALGAANVASGLLQGFPVSSSGSRTAIGASVGSRSQVFSLVALATVVVTVYVGRDLLALFPTAALGALVVYAALRLVELPEWRRLARFRLSELVLAAVTTVAVLALDVLYGILVAVGLSLADLLRRVARPHAGVLGYAPGVSGMHDIDDFDGVRQVPGLVVFRYDSPLFFANAEDFSRRAHAALSDAPTPTRWFLLNAEAIVQVDLTSLDVLEDLRADLAARDVRFTLVRAKQELLEELARTGFVERLGPDAVFPTLPTAVRAYLDRYRAEHGALPDGLEMPRLPKDAFTDTPE